MSGIIQKRQSLHRQLRENKSQIDHLQQEIRNAQKLASLGTMSCLVAHEFNNLLTPIINYAELALKHPDDPQLMQKALEKAVKQGNKASQIIQSILGFARQESREPQLFALRPLIDDCFQCLARDFKKDRITVTIDIPDDIELAGFAGQLQQVFLNLIINARHAMLERGGQLTITARPADHSTITIEVTDTGSGIEKEIRTKIFEPFFSTKAQSQGTGLGLSVCQDIVEAHQGNISVRSETGRGTTFKITLPDSSNPCPAVPLEE